MKRFFTLVAIVFAGFSFFTSCSSKHSEKKKQIDNMLADLKVAQQRIDSVDIDKITKLYNESDKQMQFLQKNYKNDTIDKATAFLLGDFRTSFKSLKRLVETHIHLTQEIEYTAIQLNNLKADLGKDLLTEEKINEYFSTENNAVQKINEKSKNINGKKATAIFLSKNSKPQVDSLILEMNRNGIR